MLGKDRYMYLPLKANRGRGGTPRGGRGGFSVPYRGSRTLGHYGTHSFVRNRQSKGFYGWSDFGGRSEVTDKNNYINTACREFVEETSSAVLSYNEIKEKLINSSDVTRIYSKTVCNYTYVMFLVFVPYKDYSKDFLKANQFLNFMGSDEKHCEKTHIAWFSLDIIREFLRCRNEKKSLTPFDFKLRPVFEKTIMRNLGVLESLEQQYIIAPEEDEK
jgi:hypothetical protein